LRCSVEIGRGSVDEGPRSFGLARSGVSEESGTQAKHRGGVLHALSFPCAACGRVCRHNGEIQLSIKVIGVSRSKQLCRSSRWAPEACCSSTSAQPQKIERKQERKNVGYKFSSLGFSLLRPCCAGACQGCKRPYGHPPPPAAGAYGPPPTHSLPGLGPLSAGRVPTTGRGIPSAGRGVPTPSRGVPTAARCLPPPYGQHPPAPAPYGQPPPASAPYGQPPCRCSLWTSPCAKPLWAASSTPTPSYGQQPPPYGQAPPPAGQHLLLTARPHPLQASSPLLTARPSTGRARTARAPHGLRPGRDMPGL